jgi:hypothetical protein
VGGSSLLISTNNYNNYIYEKENEKQPEYLDSERKRITDTDLNLHSNSKSASAIKSVSKAMNSFRNGPVRATNEINPSALYPNNQRPTTSHLHKYKSSILALILLCA